MKRIGTHSGQFHCDEVFGAMMLTRFVPEFEGASITRSRDPKVLDELDLVLDVGSVYDPERLRFDHHQKSFTESFSPAHSIRLSACGLIYKHYGQIIIPNAIKFLYESAAIPKPDQLPLPLPEAKLSSIQNSIYEGLILPIDAIDNGVPRYSSAVEARYPPLESDIGTRIGRLNLQWFEDAGETQDQRFLKAMILAEEEFVFNIKKLYYREVLSLPIVREAIEGRAVNDPSGRIIVLRKGCDWKKSLYDLERDMKIEKLAYVIYFDGGAGDWRIQAVAVAPGSFESRVPLKKDWRGLEQSALAKISGIEDIVFCHHSGFIGGALSLESVIRMGRESLAEEAQELAQQSKKETESKSE